MKGSRRIERGLCLRPAAVLRSEFDHFTHVGKMTAPAERFDFTVRRAHELVDCGERDDHVAVREVFAKHFDRVEVCAEVVGIERVDALCERLGVASEAGARGVQARAENQRGHGEDCDRAGDGADGYDCELGSFRGLLQSERRSSVVVMVRAIKKARRLLSGPGYS